MDGPPDWDLLAVVRSCTSTTTTATTTTSPTADLDSSPPHPPPPRLPPPHHEQQQLCFSPTPSSNCSSSSVLFGFSSPLTTTSFLSGQHELLDICKPLISPTTPTQPCSKNSMMNSATSSNNNFQSSLVSCSPLTSSVSSSSSIITPGRSFTIAPQQQQQPQPPLRRLVKPSHVVFGASSPTVTSSTGGSSSSQRTKKRKNLMKKVCHVPAEGLSTDMWAWRKYGQKPIKGSPYPRGYYRCSSSKGCMARKQVERNRSDPKMFIVTYTSEHNHPMPTHRNSLAGSTRQKPLTPTAEQPSCSSPSAACLSPLTESKTTDGEREHEHEGMVKDEVDNDNDNDMESLSDLMMNDDFYVGFEQIDGGGDDSDCFSDHFSPSSEFPWLASSSSTATAAGGS